MAASVASAIKAAVSKIGSPYVWGAVGPSTFDCSGLMVWAWKKEGITLPRTSQAMASYGTAVPLGKIKPGDLVTSNWGSGPSSHVAMYVGGGKVIHAPRPGRSVTLANLDATYKSKINAVRRVPGTSSAGVDEAGFGLPSPGDIFDWEKQFLEDMGEAGADAGGLTSTLTAPLRIAGAALGSIATSLAGVGQFATLLMKLALPSTWVRIACGLLGTVILFLGLGFLVREARGA